MNNSKTKRHTLQFSVTVDVQERIFKNVRSPVCNSVRMDDDMWESMHTKLFDTIFEEIQIKIKFPIVDLYKAYESLL